METKQKGFQGLAAWKTAHEMVLLIYSHINEIPVMERYNIRSQLLRAAVSVPTNIAEGTGRNTHKEMIHFFIIARGSLEELKYLIILTRDLKYINSESYNKVFYTIERTSRLINGLIRSLRANN
jgi:four helix bundle protein